MSAKRWIIGGMIVAAVIDTAFLWLMSRNREEDE